MQTIQFPEFSGIRCLMMPYIQGDPNSISDLYRPYKEIISSVFLKKGDIGFLTIDESPVVAGTPHRGARAKHGRALHTEAGKIPGFYCWGSGGYVWGSPPPPEPKPQTPQPKEPQPKHTVTLDRNVRILLANNLDDSCAVWDDEYKDTSLDGDIGFVASEYPYSDAILMKAGEVHEIGILTPHESLPVAKNFNRQFLRIVGSGVYGCEPYFTKNELM